MTNINDPIQIAAMDDAEYHRSIAEEDYKEFLTLFNRDLQQIADMKLSDDVKQVLSELGDKFKAARAERIRLEDEIAKQKAKMEFEGRIADDIDFDPEYHAMKKQLSQAESEVQNTYRRIYEKLKVVLLSSNRTENQISAKICQRAQREVNATLQVRDGRTKMYIDMLYKKLKKNGYDDFFKNVRENYAQKRGYTPKGMGRVIKVMKTILEEVNNDFRKFAADDRHGLPNDLPHPYFTPNLEQDITLEKILSAISKVENEFLNRLENFYGVEYKLLLLRYRLIESYNQRVLELLNEYIAFLKGV